MTTPDLRTQALATVLAGIAGYVDACGFLATGGYFVSFMSGNSTRLGIGLSQGIREAAVATGLVSCFVAGVILGALVGHAARDQRRSVVLIMVALLLAASAGSSAVAISPIVAAPMALAMGMLNTVFERRGEVSIGITYMTGSLVKLGVRVAAALQGGDRGGWIPPLVLWLGFVAGVSAGALAYPRVGLAGLWGTALLAAALALANRHRADPSRSSRGT